MPHLTRSAARGFQTRFADPPRRNDQEHAERSDVRDAQKERTAALYQLSYGNKSAVQQTQPSQSSRRRDEVQRLPQRARRLRTETSETDLRRGRGLRQMP